MISSLLWAGAALSQPLPPAAEPGGLVSPSARSTHRVMPQEAGDLAALSSLLRASELDQVALQWAPQTRPESRAAQDRSATRTEPAELPSLAPLLSALRQEGLSLSSRAQPDVALLELSLHPPASGRHPLLQVTVHGHQGPIARSRGAWVHHPAMSTEQSLLRAFQRAAAKLPAAPSTSGELGPRAPTP